MQEDGHLAFTPSRRINKRLTAADPDRYVLELAERTEGTIVSTNEYTEIMGEKHSWRKMIEERLLMFSFVGDTFKTPYDPLGRDGPTLHQCLCMPENRKRHTVPYYQERNPQNNARNAGKRQRDNSEPRQSGHIFQRPPFHKQRSGRSKYPHRQYDNSHS